MHIEKQTTYLRQPISVEKRVAVTLWKLATNVEYCILSALFAIGHSTVCVIVIETCNAIAKHLFPRYVYFPTGERLKDVVTNFETCWGFPQAAGDIDESHIYSHYSSQHVSVAHSSNNCVTFLWLPKKQVVQKGA